MRNRSLALTAAATVVLLVRPALALGPVDVEVAGKLGYGTDGYGFALGGRAGVAVFGFYGGFNLANYFGGPTSSCQNGICRGLSDFASAFTVGGELGYGIRLGFVTIRPLVGFGLEQFSVLYSTFGTQLGNDSFYIEPGGLVQFGFGHLIFGVEASALLPTAPLTAKALTVDGQLGVRF